MDTAGTSALALPDRQPLMMVPAIPTETEVRSLALIADYAARSNFLRSTAPKQDQAQRQADAFFVIMYGRELGIPPMTALKMIYVLDGQPSAATQAIVALARRRGVEIDIPDPSTVTDSATVRIKRPGGQWKSYTFTMDMAKKMGLSGKKNWTGMQPVMLCWRAAGMGLRFEGGDYIGGLVPLEELAPDTSVNEDGEPVGQIVISKPEPEAKPQIEAPKTDEPEPHWSDTEGAIAELVDRACKAGYIPECNVGELLKLLKVDGFEGYATRKEAGEAIKEAGEARKNAAAAIDAITAEQAAALLAPDKTPIGRTPEPAITEPGAVALLNGENKPKSPFTSDIVGAEMSDAEKRQAQRDLELEA